MKHVDNYMKSVWSAEQAVLKNPDISREELEAFQIDKERWSEWLETSKVVERVVCIRDRRDAGVGVEYFCEWKGDLFITIITLIRFSEQPPTGLPHSDCTW